RPGAAGLADHTARPKLPRSPHVRACGPAPVARRDRDTHAKSGLPAPIHPRTTERRNTRAAVAAMGLTGGRKRIDARSLVSVPKTPCAQHGQDQTRLIKKKKRGTRPSASFQLLLPAGKTPSATTLKCCKKLRNRNLKLIPAI